MNHKAKAVGWAIPTIAMFLFWVNFVVTMPGCSEPPSATCNEVCDGAKPSACTGSGEILSVNELSDEEPLGTASHWMCVCTGEGNQALQYLAPRNRCSLPRGRTAYGEGESSWIDD